VPHHYFFIPARQPSPAQDELRELTTHLRVLTLTQHFVADGAQSGWAVCVETVDGPGPLPAGLKAESSARSVTARGKPAPVDYKQLLNERDFTLFAALRDLRRELAQAEGVPPYAVFTNEQLAAIVTGGVDTVAGLQAVEGIGPARIDKYASAVLSCLQARRAVLPPAGEAAR
jgi:superfamily II DNA helicase RecQ